MEERIYWLGFAVFPGIGPARLTELLEKFGTAEKAWHGSLEELITTIGPSLAHKFGFFRESFSLESYLERLKKAQVSFISQSDADYPVLLKEIHHPPIVLFYKGNKEILCHPESRLNRTQNEPVLARTYVGVVGTRKITSYGKQVTEKITEDLVAAGCVIVSGLAMGVDAVAHKTTVENHGATIAVLGCGVDCCNPTINQSIYMSIIENNGVIVSEYPLSEPPSIGSFPSRNRIIAGLSHAVVVTEGAADSGALITAKDALAARRHVFAVPGPITSSLSFGPNTLIKAGAKMVTSGSDVLEILGVNQRGISTIKEKVIGETPEEQTIIDALFSEPLTLDELVRKTTFSSQQVSVVLSLLEMRGVLSLQADGAYNLV